MSFAGACKTQKVRRRGRRRRYGLITCILALRDQIIPPTTSQSTPDPECDLDYIPNVPRKAKVNVCMSNNFGFGGQNNTLIIAKANRD